MSKSVEDILGFVPLTEMLRATTSGIPDPFPAELSAVKPANRIMGDRAKFTRVKGARTTAKLATYGSPARRVPLQDVGSQTIRMLHTYIEFQVDVIMLQKLMSFEQYAQDEGLDWLQYQIDEVARRIVNTRIISKASMLQYGAIYWDGDGNLLPTSSGAVYTISSQLGATHLNQLNNIISASWALSNTDLPGQIRTLQQQAAQASGLKVETAMYGINAPKYIAQNSYAIPFLSRDGRFRDEYNMSGEIPSGLFGIKRWVPVYETFFEDQNGTNQTFWGADAVVFVPALNQPDKMDWWAQYEGSFPVPKSFDIATDAMAALQSFSHEHGTFGYSVPNVLQSPPGITTYLGDVQLPVYKNELAPYSAVVAF